MDNFSLCYADPAGGPTVAEDFSLTDGYAGLSPTYDPAGNMASDSVCEYTYENISFLPHFGNVRG